MFYDFQPYDVLQVLRSGSWVDFSTLRTQEDGEAAKAIVDRGTWERVPQLFRIVGPTAGKLVKYWKLGQNQALGRCYCGDKATTILEWDLDGKSYGPDYLCRRHATVEAEKILDHRGSPRLGNV